jgi:hypothetical protein
VSGGGGIIPPLRGGYIPRSPDPPYPRLGGCTDAISIRLRPDFAEIRNRVFGFRLNRVFGFRKTRNRV